MAWVNILELFYPIGIIIEFGNDQIDPAETFGGTWERLTETSPYRWIRIG